MMQLDSDLIELLVQNLSRLDETSDVDRDGVYYILGGYCRPRYTYANFKVCLRIWLRKRPSRRGLGKTQQSCRGSCLVCSRRRHD